MLAHSSSKAGTLEAIKPRAIAILFLIVRYHFILDKSSSTTEFQ